MNIGILLAAGSGTRMSKTHNISHKCMMKINNTTFIENTLKQLDEVCDIIYVVTGHKATTLELTIRQIELELTAEVVVLENTQYSTTNNITSMDLALDNIALNEITVTNMFYAESDIYYVPSVNIFKSMLEDSPVDNVRAALWTPKGQAEWRIDWDEDNTRAINYLDDDEAGISVIGAAKFDGIFVKHLATTIKDVLKTNNQIYWDEAERLLLETHDVYPYILSDHDIIEVDNENDFNRAISLGYDITI